MITDLISRLPLYESQIPGAGRIAAAFAAQAPESAPCEVRQKAYAPKQPQQRRFEAHYHTIDLMMARSGAVFLRHFPGGSPYGGRPRRKRAPGHRQMGRQGARPGSLPHRGIKHEKKPVGQDPGHF